MSITILGAICLPLSIWMLFFKKEWLFYACLFFMPFTASSVFNLEKGISFGVQPGFWFGALWMLVKLIDICKNGITISKTKEKFIKTVLIFMGIIILSTIMPILLNLAHYDLTVINPSNGMVPLKFTSSNITQVMYFVFALFITIFSCLEITTREKLVKSIKVFIFSGAVTLGWGIIQFVLHYLKIDYPHYIFNTNIGMPQHWNQIAGKIKRINSVAPEPSMYVFYLIIFIPIVTFLLLKMVKVINTKVLAIVTIISFGVAVLTTSSTAYVCLPIFVVALHIYAFFVKDKEITKKIIILDIAFVAMGVITVLLLPIVLKMPITEFINVIIDMTIGKLSSGSGMERMGGFRLGIDVFLMSPILGVGWGSNRTFDFLSTLLSTTGMVGMGTYIYITYQGIKATVDTVKLSKSDKLLSTISVSLVFALGLANIAYAISIPDVVFLYFWFVLGLSVAVKGLSPNNTETSVEIKPIKNYLVR